MKTVKNILTVFAVAAMVNVNAQNVPTLNYLIQVKALASQFESVEKQVALNKICDYYSSSKFSNEMLLEYTNLIAQTQNNLEVISYSAELASKENKYSEIFLGIAKTTANSNIEKLLLMDILTITYQKCKEKNMVLIN